jgi:hypothetical protein
MIKELIKKTRSYRSFTQDDISRYDLVNMIETARFSGSTGNVQAIRYVLVTEKRDRNFVFRNCKFAGFLDWNPSLHEAPVAYIIMCYDESAKLKDDWVALNMGIASQNIMLTASEMGFGGCLIGAFNKPEINKYFDLKEKCGSYLVIALGKPAETVEVVEATSEDTKYYRENGIHYVPKLSVDKLIIK